MTRLDLNVLTESAIQSISRLDDLSEATLAHELDLLKVCAISRGQCQLKVWVAVSLEEGVHLSCQGRAGRTGWG
jgi:hypothetical protein